MINNRVNMHTARMLLMSVLAAATLVSCATRGFDGEIPLPSSAPSGTSPDDFPELPAVPAGQQAAVGTVTPAPSGSSIDGGPAAGASMSRNSINDPGHPLARRIIFFGYNSAEIGADSISLLELHAQYLSQFRDVRVRLEGHTDERGSREYNIALGDNRSRGVARILQLQGVDAGQFSTLSYGEEVPLDEGRSESAYRRNRRVELVYEGLN